MKMSKKRFRANFMEKWKKQERNQKIKVKKLDIREK